MTSTEFTGAVIVYSVPFARSLLGHPLLLLQKFRLYTWIIVFRSLVCVQLKVDRPLSGNILHWRTWSIPAVYLRVCWRLLGCVQKSLRIDQQLVCCDHCILHAINKASTLWGILVTHDIVRMTAVFVCMCCSWWWSRSYCGELNWKFLRTVYDVFIPVATQTCF